MIEDETVARLIRGTVKSSKTLLPSDLPPKISVSATIWQ
jgi:hypothetical protein